MNNIGKSFIVGGIIGVAASQLMGDNSNLFNWRSARKMMRKSVRAFSMFKNMF